VKFDFSHRSQLRKRVLIRGVNWVGDTILTFPMVQSLKSIFPQSHLAVLIPRHLQDLWKTFPFVDEVIPFDKKGGLRSFWKDLPLSIFLKKKKFDIAFILPRSFHSAFQIYLARIPVRVGYLGQWRSGLLTHGVPEEQGLFRVHRVHYYQKLVSPLGDKGKVPPPHLSLREEDRKWAEDWMRQFGFSDEDLLIGINPGATYGLAKCWFADRFGELGRRLSEKWNATVILFGKEHEKPMAKEVLQKIGQRGIDLTGQTDLLQLASLLERCQLLVTNDTGTMHIASAVGTEVVALFGPTDTVTTGPWGDGHVVIKKDVPCSPCLKRICPKDHQCMKSITVEEVEEAVEAKLGKRKR